jgi:hypothetical protein
LSMPLYRNGKDRKIRETKINALSEISLGLNKASYQHRRIR